MLVNATQVPLPNLKG